MLTVSRFVLSFLALNFILLSNVSNADVSDFYRGGSRVASIDSITDVPASSDDYKILLGTEKKVNNIKFNFSQAKYYAIPNSTKFIVEFYGKQYITNSPENFIISGVFDGKTMSNYYASNLNITYIHHGLFGNSNRTVFFIAPSNQIQSNDDFECSSLGNIDGGKITDPANPNIVYLVNVTNETSGDYRYYGNRRCVITGSTTKQSIDAKNNQDNQKALNEYKTDEGKLYLQMVDDNCIDTHGVTVIGWYYIFFKSDTKLTASYNCSLKLDYYCRKFRAAKTRVTDSSFHHEMDENCN